jgi:hypothetical protein
MGSGPFIGSCMMLKRCGSTLRNRLAGLALGWTGTRPIAIPHGSRPDDRGRARSSIGWNVIMSRHLMPPDSRLCRYARCQSRKYFRKFSGKRKGRRQRTADLAMGSWPPPQILRSDVGPLALRLSFETATASRCRQFNAYLVHGLTAGWGQGLRCRPISAPSRTSHGRACSYSSSALSPALCRSPRQTRYGAERAAAHRTEEG